MADKKTDFDELFGKKEPDRKPKKTAAAPAQRKAPPQARPSAAAAAKKENKSGLAGGALYFLFVISVSIILACLAWAAATDVLGFKSSDTVAQITLDKDSFTYKEVEVKDDDGNTKTKKVHYADMSYVADQLKDNGIIKYKWLFKLFGSVYNADEKIDPGTYELKAIYDYKALVKKMTSGSAAMVTKKITFPEGYTMRQIFKKLDAEGVCDYDELMDAAANSTFNYSFLEGTEKGDASRLEGFLFPDTYDFYKNSTPREVLEKLLDNFERRFDEEMQAQIETLNANVTGGGYGVREVAIVASMIEKEAAAPSEAPAIAGVIYNRLFRWDGTPAYLNIDASIVYALDGKTDLTREDLQVDSPYNTYTHTGLTPTPISNPGLSSLRAALNPENHNYYYYVLNPETGMHTFSTTYEEHSANVAAYAEGQ